VYHIDRAYPSNNYTRLAYEKSRTLAKQLATDPVHIPSEYQDKEPLLVLPLAKGAKWAGDPVRGDYDNYYCWYVADELTDPVALLGGRTATTYEVTYQTNPDHSIMEIVPGLGITRYVYSHHGTPAETDVRLVSFGTAAQGANARTTDGNNKTSELSGK
jgi:hypothetical protein